MTTLQTFAKCLGVILVEILIRVSNFSSLNLSDKWIRHWPFLYCIRITSGRTKPTEFIFLVRLSDFPV